MPPFHVSRYTSTPSSRSQASKAYRLNKKRQSQCLPHPIARAVAILLAAGAAGAPMSVAYAQQAFSPAWFANKGVVQNSASTTGYLPNGTPASALTNPAQQQQQANAQLQLSINNLTALARGIAAQQAAQEAARQAALANGGSVPDGLVDGGLKVDTNSLTQGWINANAPTQTTANGKTTVAIQQTADKAILNWETFNVGRDTIVRFMQDPNWAVLNRVNDPLARPSQIQGQIQGDGTVMILNRNGIIFSGGSQVDTRNLVAAAAAITDAQFQANGIYGINASTPSFTDANGKLIVEAGAQLSTAAPTSATQGGGYVLLLGSEVNNGGTISTPKGQVELAAGDNFIIRKGYGTDANAPSTTRGNEVSPQFVVGSTAGKVVNAGLLIAPEGDITLAGRDVQQNGVAISTTTVNTRGTIHLLNSASDTQGSVTLGNGSITTVVVQDDGATALDSQRDALIKDSAAQDVGRNNTGTFDNLSNLSDRRDQSRIEIVSGGDVGFENGSLTLATGGQIAVSAKNRSFVAAGATLDVSGAVGVNLAMASNNVAINVQGNEQRDAPANRDSGDLLNANVWIDRRKLIYVPAGTGGYSSDRWYTAGGLLEVSGYLGNQGHGIGEWAAQGGTVMLGGSEVVTQTGSDINLSGGSLNVQSGYLNVSWLKGSDGQLYRVDTAPANLNYSGAYKGFEVAHARWGANTTEYYYNPLIAPQRILQDGYTVGRDAGRLLINAPTAVLEGGIDSSVYNGPQQTQAAVAGVTDAYKQSQYAVARPAGLALGQYGNSGRLDAYASDVRIGDIADITTAMAAGDVLDASRIDTVWLDAARLTGEKLGLLDLATAGAISVDSALGLGNGGQLSLIAPEVNINATVTARSGGVTVSNFLKPDSPAGAFALTTAGGTSQLTLASGAAIDTRGLWVNLRDNSGDSSNLAFLNGGNVSFDSTQNVTLAAGSTIDVSSGGAILVNGKTRGGTGGNVALTAGHVYGSLSAVGALVIDGDIRAVGVNGGGALTVSTPGNILLGDNAVLSGGVLNAGEASPIELKLAQPLTIPAGQPLPITLIQSFASLAPGAVAPVDIVPVLVPKNLVNALPWVVPAGMGMVWVDQTNYSEGQTVPAHSTISSFIGSSKILAGTSIDPAIFPNGLPIQPYKIVHMAGSVSPTPLTYLAGTTIPTGTVLSQTVAVVPALSPTFFSAGFASYDLNAGNGILVANGSSVVPTMPVYRITDNSFNTPSGSDPATAMPQWLPPLFTENPMQGTLTQRGGASLTLRSLNNNGVNSFSGSSIVVGDGASITVDPGQSIKFDAFGQLTVNGSLTAHGGSISLISDADGRTLAASNFDQYGASRGMSIWIGANALLDVSAARYSARDASGRAYGTLTNGGSIYLGGNQVVNASTTVAASTTAFLIIRPGAELNADGAQIAINPVSANALQTVASNGGSITLNTYSGIYNDGNLHAASGGAGGAGGSLSLMLDTPIYPTSTVGTLPSQAQARGVMTVVQSAPVSALPPDLQAGVNAAGLAFGRTVVSADAIKAGGFDTLSLSSANTLLFSGDVSLSLGQSLTLTTGGIDSGILVFGAPPAGPLGGKVTLNAPYVRLAAPPIPNTDNSNVPTVSPNIATASSISSFTVNADQIDLIGANGLSSAYKSVTLNSQGDIRFLAAPANLGNVSRLGIAGDLYLNAAQIYPATGAVASMTADTVSIARSTDAADPALPMSVFGSLAIHGRTIAQGGVVRAPLGLLVLGDNGGGMTSNSGGQTLDLLPGSITSVSAAGLIMPYGGTIDGVTYNYNGTAVAPWPFNTDLFGRLLTSGIVLGGQSVNVHQGATLDLSGGGTLTGAGFVSGRGGSVNVLNTPLVNANPTTPISKAGDKVYAIVPGYASGYAPIAAENGAGDPAIGRQITIPAGVPGLPAGTYTLLPSNYALLPGAFRVEIGNASATPLGGTIAIGNGTYATSGVTSVANTGIADALASRVLITPGTTVRRYAQYNEQNYSDFLVANAARFGAPAPLLPGDGKTLELIFQPRTAAVTTPSLSFDGTAQLQGASGGLAGEVFVGGGGNLEVVADAPTAGFNGISLNARDLNAVGAPRLLLGGYEYLNQPGSILTFKPVDNGVYVRNNVSLQADEIFLIGGNNGVSVGAGATLSTLGRGAGRFPAYTYGSDGATVLALSNGDLAFNNSNGPGAITIGAGASLFAEQTLAFVTSGQSSIDSSAHFGARNIALAVGNINLGDSDVIAAAGAGVPNGMLFNQALFDVLVGGNPGIMVPRLERLTLSAFGSINIFGNSSLDAGNSGVNLVFNTPAIYGYGAAGDHAVIAADKISWNGIANTPPPAILANGPGTGAGTLDFKANEIDLGKVVSLDATASSRILYGFGNVNLIAGSQIVTAGKGSLALYQAASTVPGDVFGQSGSGGNLNLSTPLLTGASKSIATFTAGGMLTVAAPAGMAPSGASSSVAGAEIDLNGDSVVIGSTILLPSGKLVVNADHDITLDAGSRIDLSGQPSMIQRATVYGFGGDAVFNSAAGSISQAAGGIIDVSATKASAGAITIAAGNGAVALAGALKGAATDGNSSGDFSVSAGTLADFAGLNAALNQGGIFDARSFDLKTGNLTIGDGVKARNVTVSVDSGSLIVNGTIDASGNAPGTIRLAAGNGLTLASTAVLDAHGSVLQTDSYGAAIEAKNRGHVELTAAGGTLTLTPGATIDLSTPGATNYGDVVLNAQRTGETSGDIAISASGPLSIKGANSIALNALWTYNLAGGSVITQSTLDGYDTQSQAFIDAAYGGNVGAGMLTSGLQGKLGGLLAQGTAFHLRPGVQITSSGDLSVTGDINLAGYRYGPGANRDQTSVGYGAGEPMDLVLRAGGNLDIKGSISDGFGPLPGMPATDPVYSGVVAAGSQVSSTWLFTSTIYILAPWQVPNDPYYSIGGDNYLYDYTTGISYPSGSMVPAGAQFKADGWNSFLNGYALPNYATGIATPGRAATPPLPPTSALAVLLSGVQSASLRLVAGADLAAADPRMLQTARALNGSGNLTLNDPAYQPSSSTTFFSVLRTGTGSLELLAGGSFSEATPYGVYTAGTQAAPILAADGSNPYNLLAASGSGLQAWYPEHGGDLLLMAQQDVSGSIQIADNVVRYADSDLTGNWLWRQGGSGSDPSAWWINFGSNVNYDKNTRMTGFQGIGTLGGGNLAVIAGRNAGVFSASSSSSTGLDLAVASSGRVLADGTLVQTGGGDLTLKVGGWLNQVSKNPSDYAGSVTDLRGNIVISAGAIGNVTQSISGYSTSIDPRTLDSNTFKHAGDTPGPTISPGDGTVTINARGNLVLGGVGDPGMATPVGTDGMPYTAINPDGSTTLVSNGGTSSFTLWRPATAIALYSAGGDVMPLAGGTFNNFSQNANGYYPGTLSVVAANGDIRFAELASGFVTAMPIELLPSPIGQLDLLAAGTIYGSGQVVSMSGADLSALATPARTLFYTKATGSNASTNAGSRVDHTPGNNPFAFGQDTPSTNLHAGDSQPVRIYAGVDIDDLALGQVKNYAPAPGSGFVPDNTTWYTAAKPVEMIAGRDIVGMGAIADVFFNNNATDISFMHAGRDIIYQSVTIAGPGTLVLQAGRNLYQGYQGSLESVGPLFGVNSSNRSGGAGISVLAGVGAAGADYADFARMYFDPANALPAGTALAGSGKVVHTYEQELLAWLQQRYGYAGTAADALTYFLALPSEQQGVFVRQVYFTELTAGGREYNDTASVRYGSYLRGRDAIAALFPSQDAQGKAIGYAGGITMFSSIVQGKTLDAGIRTDFGGDIQLLAPGGQTIVGVEGVTPGASAGLITQGSGNIDVYAKGSILLGLSRMMTTFGGGIVGWSAEGDINAGRGSKTTVLYTLPRRIYDDEGNVTLSPNVPSSGAGIATLNPIPEVKPGDVDLIAPLGTIDAGEAGIRVSGNVNLAALQVVNAANIQVQGKSTGLPALAAVNVGALTNASAAASSAVTAAQDAVARDRAAARQNLPSVFTVRVLGFGSDGSGPDSRPLPNGAGYENGSAFQVLGQGSLTPAQRARLTETERRNLTQ
jgi:filamentous hemagglutinin family protein